MKIIIDQRLPPVLAQWLRAEHDIDAVHVREIRLKDTPDHDIWLEAKRRGAVVISRDTDFANFARQDVAGRLVWLRIGNRHQPRVDRLVRSDLAHRVGQASRRRAVRRA